MIVQHKLISDFAEGLMERSDLQGHHVTGYLKSMDEEDMRSLEDRLEFFVKEDGFGMADIIDSYLAWCSFFVEERKYFVEHDKTYRNRSFADIDHLYKDDKYMRDYMIGLSISAYLWNIQRSNLHFFRDWCSIQNKEQGSYLEVGSGHGEYLMTAVKYSNFDKYKAIDISQSATKETDRFIDFCCRNDAATRAKIDVKCNDFFEENEECKYDAIVISQVIEHVEKPYEFLLKARRITGKNSWVYVSTAINSPFPDHIYHFHNRKEVIELIREAGFEIVKEFQAASDGISLERAERKDYDIVIGVILR